MVAVKIGLMSVVSVSTCIVEFTSDEEATLFFNLENGGLNAIVARSPFSNMFPAQE